VCKGLRGLMISILPVAGRWVASALLVVVIFPTTRASARADDGPQGVVSYTEEPINYVAAPSKDAVARLQQRLDRGEVALRRENERGFLSSVLEQLKVPISSQALVFSRTSFQRRMISPAAPRALYFNDDVYVGWVKGARFLEVASFDRNQGAIFYLLEQNNLDAPSFRRADTDCLKCHVTAATRGVPGVFVQSVQSTSSGTLAPNSDTFVTGHESPLSQRFGGWYVTAKSRQPLHMGNAFVDDPIRPASLKNPPSENVDELSKRFDASAFLTAQSDLVAQLVLAHQTQLHNLITLTNYQTRIALHEEKKKGRAADAMSAEARKTFETPAEELLKYLLLIDEAPLPGPIEGNSGFAEEFSSRGPRDPQGRSLRQFDLKSRLFKFKCSYLIYGDAFDALPAPAKSYVYRRLREVLTGADRSPAFARLSDEDRRAVLEILLATKEGLPDEWKRMK
jgi:hypothetical protein